MKKSPRFHLLTAALVLVALIGLLAYLPTTAQAATVTASGSCGASATWSLDSDGVLTISGSGKMTTFKKNDKPWGDHTAAITKVVIEEGITSIGAYAFKNCVNLESITVPASVSRTGTTPFDGCDKLTRVDISDLKAWCRIAHTGAASNPLTIAKNLYLNGQLVTDLVIPEGITAIADFAFNGCASIKTLKLPAGLTNIGQSAFNDCVNLTAVNMPASLSTLGNLAFGNCVAMDKVEIEDLAAWCGVSMDNPNNNPIYKAGKLYVDGQLVTDLVIPETVTRLQNYVFAGCKSLKTVTFPQNLTSLGKGAMRECTGLTAIVLPDTVTHINYEAFNQCTGLVSVKLSAQLVQMDNTVFARCTSLKTITLPANLVTLDNGNFSGCTSLRTVIFLGTPTTLGSKVFDNCTALQHVLYVGSQTDWSAVQMGDGNEVLTNATWHYNVTDTTAVDPETGICKLCQAACEHSFGADDICTKCGLANPNPTKPTDPTEPANPVEKENPFPIFVVVIAVVAVVAVAAVVIVVLKKKK